ASESPTSKLNPHPARSSSKWRVSFAESGPLRRRLTRSLAGNGFARVYGGATTEPLACMPQTMSAYRRQSRSAQAYSKTSSNLVATGIALKKISFDARFQRAIGTLFLLQRPFLGSSDASAIAK